jgi:hypothetical protein
MTIGFQWLDKHVQKRIEGHTVFLSVPLVSSRIRPNRLLTSSASAALGSAIIAIDGVADGLWGNHQVAAVQFRSPCIVFALLRGTTLVIVHLAGPRRAGRAFLSQKTEAVNLSFESSAVGDAFLRGLFPKTRFV